MERLFKIFKKTFLSKNFFGKSLSSLTKLSPLLLLKYMASHENKKDLSPFCLKKDLSPFYQKKYFDREWM